MTAAAVAIDAMTKTRRLPPRHVLIVKLPGQSGLVALTSPVSRPRLSTGTHETRSYFDHFCASVSARSTAHSSQNHS
jgi:hypothetical protein